jgi:hypothetical protein
MAAALTGLISSVAVRAAVIQATPNEPMTPIMAIDIGTQATSAIDLLEPTLFFIATPN